MASVRIVLLCLVAAISYGILHDQVTARVCIEYFTIGHPPLIQSESPTMLALAWGIVATWWVGLPLGLLLAMAARAGARPKLVAGQLRPTVLRLLLVMATCALAAALIGYALAKDGVVHLTGALSERVPVARHERFLADLWAHNASYASGIVGGIVVCVQTYRRRRRDSRTGSCG